MSRTLRAGELGREAGVGPQTLRYYERRGLLPEPSRTLGGHREYPAEAVDHLKLIKAAQRLGFTLREIRELLGIAKHRHRSQPDLRDRAREKRAEIDARIADLHAIRDALTQVLDAGCDDLANCSSPDCPLPSLDLTG